MLRTKQLIACGQSNFDKSYGQSHGAVLLPEHSAAPELIFPLTLLELTGMTNVVA
jgi:hypothetical protein